MFGNSQSENRVSASTDWNLTRGPTLTSRPWRLKKHQVDAAHTEIQSMAKERQLAINADHPIVVEFWELYEYLNSAAGGLNHSRNDGLIAVNLNDFAKEAAEKRQKVPDLTELKRHLKTSKCPKFIETNRNVCSAWDVDAANKAKTVRCWMFQTA